MVTVRRAATPAVDIPGLLSADEIVAQLLSVSRTLSEGERAYVLSKPSPVPNSVYVTLGTDPDPTLALFDPVITSATMLNEGQPVRVRIEADGNYWVLGTDKAESWRAFQQLPPAPNLSLAQHDHEDEAGGGQLNATNVFNAGNVPKARQAADTVYTDDAQTLTNKTLTSPTLTTPVIASFASAGHTHQNAAGGGTLDAAAIASGMLNNARVNWSSPSAIGGTTPAAGRFTGLALAASTELTIASGAVTVTQSRHRIDTQGDASTDDLDTINGGGDTLNLLIIRAEDAARTVVVTEAGNIVTGGSPIALADDQTFLILIFDATLSKWIVANAGTGGGSGSFAVTDGTVLVSPASTLVFPAGTLQDNGSGEAEYLGGGGGGGAQSLRRCDGRLTLTSGVPVTTSSVTGAGTLYFTPHRGNVVSLYDGSGWVDHSLTERSLSLSGLDRHRLYDIFLYNLAGTLTLEAIGWTAPPSGAISNVTNANPPVVTSTAHGLAVGDVVTIYGVVGATGVNGTFRVSAQDANTFTLQTLAAANPGAPGAYSSGGTWVKKNYAASRATALATQDGTHVLTGDATRLYLGTIGITAAGGESEDTVTARLVWNYYNRVERIGHFRDSTGSNWTYNSAAYRAAGNNLARAVDVVIGLSEDVLKATVMAGSSGSGAAGHVGIGIDSATVNSALLNFEMSVGALFVQQQALYRGHPGAGRHTITWLEYVRTGTLTWIIGGASIGYPGLLVEMLA
jgi:hypothetical protein